MQLILAIVIIFSHFSLRAQVCKIQDGYAYQRMTIPGNIPRRDLDEKGNEINKPVKMMNTLFIYVETSKRCHLQVTKVWIAGKAYRVTQEEIKELPVVIYHSHPGTPPDTLVRPTTNRVFRIQPAAEWTEEAKRAPVKATEKNIVIEYSRKGKATFHKIDEVKRIAPMLLQ